MGGHELKNLLKDVHRIENMSGLRVPSKGAATIKVKLRHIDQKYFYPKRLQEGWQTLIEEDNTYKWEELKKDIEEKGILEPIYVCYCTLKTTDNHLFGMTDQCKFRVADGNHRLRVLQEILSPDDEVEVRLLSEDQCTSDAHEKQGKTNDKGESILEKEEMCIGPDGSEVVKQIYKTVETEIFGPSGKQKDDEYYVKRKDLERIKQINRRYNKDPLTKKDKGYGPKPPSSDG